MSLPQADFDTPWKDILEAYFEECIQFFFPDVHPQIDWLRGYEFLDKELQKVVRDAEVGRRYADKLVKIWTLDGEDIWLLIHIEVQSQRETDFAQRMFTYYYRLKDRFNRAVVSFAILSDDSPSWRPTRHVEELWGCKSTFEFRTVKLLDYQQQWSQLEMSRNPFAMVVMAHLKTLETASLPEQRQRWKITLTRGLYERGYSRQDVINLTRFIDWILALPEDLEQSFWQSIMAYQQEKKMPYMMWIERQAQQKGREEGREEGLRRGLIRAIALGLKLKFGESALQLMPDVEKVESVAALEAIQESLETELSLADFCQLLSHPIST